MRDFYFLTSRPLTAKDCFDKLKEKIKNIQGTNSPDEIQLYISGKWRSFLWFYNDRLTDYFAGFPDEELEEYKKQIPIIDPYINHFETHRSIDAKRVIAVLMQLYPELYIDINDETEWQGTAQEYLDTEFDY